MAEPAKTTETKPATAPVSAPKLATPPAPKKPRHSDDELSALATINRTMATELQDLTDDEKQRILTWLWGRYFADLVPTKPVAPPEQS